MNITPEQALAELTKDFESYRAEFAKLEGICAAFEAQLQSATKALAMYDTLARKTKELVEKEDIEELKKVYALLQV